MSRPALLVAGTLAVLGALAGLWLVLRDDPPAAPRTPPAPPTAERPVPSAPAERAPNLPVVTQVERNTHAASSGATDVPPDEYVLDGIRVRDHRRPEDRQVIDVPPNIHPPNSRRIKPALTGAFTEQVIAAMRECGSGFPREALGTKPRLEGQIVIAIEGGQAKVTSATLHLRDAVGAAVEPTKQCIEQKALGLTAAAADEPDLASYSINLTFGFP